MKDEELEELEELAELDEIADFEDENEFIEEEIPSKKTSGKKSQKKGKSTKKSHKKKKKTVVISVLAAAVAAVVIIVVVVGFALGLFNGKGEPAKVTYFEVKVDMAGVRYLGNETYVAGTAKSNFNAKEALGLENTSTINYVEAGSSNATMMGSNILVSGTEGTLNVTIDGNAQSLTIVEGVNVTTRDDLVKALANNKNVVFQKEIKLNEEDYLLVKSNIYGNGFMLDGTDVVPSSDSNNQKYYRPILNYTEGAKLTLKDLHVVAKKVQEGESLELNIALSSHGIPIVCSRNSEVDIIHCVIENGHRGIYIEPGSNILIQGCIIRNTVDANINISAFNSNADGGGETNGPSHVTLRNNVLANGLAGILVSCWLALDEKNNNVITIEGFLDIYNWKSAENCNVMPETEALASMGNGAINKVINNKKYDYLAYYDEDGTKYLHCAIMVTSTGGKNNPEFIGLEAINYVEHSISAPILKTLKIVNYNSENPAIKPGEDISSNPNILKELREGRN